MEKLSDQILIYKLTLIKLVMYKTQIAVHVTLANYLTFKTTKLFDNGLDYELYDTR